MINPIKNNNKNVLGQIIAIFFIEISSSTAFGIFYSGLSIFLTQQLQFTIHDATIITGIFLSIHYFLQLIGGMIANYLVSYKNLYFFGTLISIWGCGLLALHQDIYLGLSLFLMSSLVTNVCLRMFINNLFDSTDTKKRKVAFIWNFIGINIGCLLGYFISGYSTINENFNIAFLLIAGLLSLAVCLTLLLIVDKQNTYRKTRKASQILIIILILPIIILFLYNIFKFSPFFSKYFLYLATISVLTLILYSVFKIDVKERNNYLKFMGYSGLSILFWSLYMLTPLVFMQLIQSIVNRSIGGITLAPQWFMYIDSIIILITGPILAFVINRNKKEMSSLNLYLYGLALCAFGLMILLYGLGSCNHFRILPWSILSCMALFAVAETLISPLGNALVGELIPPSIQPLMTGFWSMNIGIGILIATFIANTVLLPYINNHSLLENNFVTWENAFVIIIIMLFLLILGIFTCTKLKNFIRVNKSRCQYGNS